MYVIMNNAIVKTGDLYLNTPFRMTVSGSSGTGKTQWIQRFIRHHEQIVGFHFDTVLFIYGEYQPLFNVIKQEHPEILWCEGFCHETILDKLHPNTENKLMIIDDLLNEITKDKLLEAFYIKKSHHWNVSIIITTQHLHDKHLRLIHLNTTDYILFKSVRDITPIRVLGLQMYPTKWRQFIEIYTHATRYVFLLYFLNINSNVI